ncbi:MAG TPA: TRAP transporter large permease subunit [Burkholderiaceae bacterium]|nr:TRAP transporter large permease subunit [Burkholderiaceae bacterium]
MTWIAANLAPIMFASLVVFLLSGFPVAFALAASGMVFGFIAIELGLMPPALLQALPLRLIGIMQNDTLLAIPFFTFMGLILERSGMAEDLLETVGQVFGPVRGGVALAVVVVGAMLAATTGVMAASVISMGLISLPIMLRYGYNRPLATGAITASGTLAQIIPPSLVLIVIADQLGRSVGDMYRAAFIPGFALVGLYCLFVIAVAIVRPKWVPALPPEARVFREPNGASGHLSLFLLLGLCTAVAVAFANNYGSAVSWWTGVPNPPEPIDEVIVMSLSLGVVLAFLIALLNRLLRVGLLSRLAEQVTFVLIPPLLLVFLVLGTIFLGIATPTEGGAMGATGALILALSRNKLSFTLLKQALNNTAKLSCFVLFVLIGSTVFSLTFQGVDGPVWVEHLFDQLPGGTIGFLLFVNFMIFVLGFFLDFFEIAFILLPMLAPVAVKMDVDLIWFGIMVAINLQTSFLTPPFGFALFYLRSVAAQRDYDDRITRKRISRVSTGDIYRGSIPFVLMQLLVLAAVMLFPETVLIGVGPPVDLDTIKIEIPGTEPDAAPDPLDLFRIPSDPAAPGAAPPPPKEDPADALMRLLREPRQ